MRKTLWLLVPAILLAVAGLVPPRFSRAERQIIRSSEDSLLYVTVISLDSAILRTPSRDLSRAELRSKDLKTLTAKMLYTVRHPSQDGVGIAAPQVGIGRRIAWVQRFDKPGEPFECYLNLHIEERLGEVTSGPEGCLSVPPMRGLVPRYGKVVISYLDPDRHTPRRETVEGYTAIIFQHECDHLDGILYIDRADTVFVDEAWAAELSENEAR